MEKKKSAFIKSMQYSTIGVELGLSISIGALIGYWLDQKFGTEPWLTLFFLICGIVAGFGSLYRVAKKYLKESKNDENQASD
jgi:ATP synthase protein I